MTTELLEQYGRLQASVGARYGLDMDDVIQEGALWLLENGESIDAERGPQTYIMTSTARLCSRMCAREAEQFQATRAAALAAETDDAFARPVEDSVIARADFQRAIQEIPPESRAIIIELLAPSLSTLEAAAARVEAQTREHHKITQADIAVGLDVPLHQVNRVIKKFRSAVHI